jgi:hypothetical protein
MTMSPIPDVIAAVLVCVSASDVIIAALIAGICAIVAATITGLATVIGAWLQSRRRDPS